MIEVYIKSKHPNGKQNLRDSNTIFQTEDTRSLDQATRLCLSESQLIVKLVETGSATIFTTG